MARHPNPTAKKTKTTSISTVVSIMLVLLMLGMFGLILLHAKKISDYVKENIVLSVIVKENSREVDIIQLQKKLDVSSFVKNTAYVSKEMAAEKLQKDLGEDFLDFLGYNPLLSTVDVYLKADYANNDSIAKLEPVILQNEIVKEVYYQKSMVNLINDNIKTISLIILAFSSILLIIALALINNTIRLAMYSQRFLIKSMQLVGATHRFISKPYLMTGVLHGIIGGLLAIIFLIGGLYFIQEQIPELIILQDIKEFVIIFVALILIGIIITWISTFFAVRKYLKLKLDDLYR